MKKRDLDGLKRGVWLEQTFGCTISELELRIVRDRFALARQCLAMAKRALRIITMADGVVKHLTGFWAG